MGFHGISMGFQWDFNGISMGFHGISWDFVGFHGISMGFHGILDALFGTTWGISATKWWFKQQLTWDIMNKNGYPIVFSKLVKIPSLYCGLWWLQDITSIVRWGFAKPTAKRQTGQGGFKGTSRNIKKMRISPTWWYQWATTNSNLAPKNIFRTRRTTGIQQLVISPKTLPSLDEELFSFVSEECGGHMSQLPRKRPWRNLFNGLFRYTKWRYQVACHFTGNILKGSSLTSWLQISLGSQLLGRPFWLT